MAPHRCFTDLTSFFHTFELTARNVNRKVREMEWKLNKSVYSCIIVHRKARWGYSGRKPTRKKITRKGSMSISGAHV